ncbi:MAG: TetR/AcrR family transcriptional regulator [Acidobacteria bacterium]|nr:TetR/AcrR family transcriptional regulator [Acidobacteriota bacterium]
MNAVSTKSHHPAGRPRSEEANTAILKAANELLETTCYKDLSMEAIAEKAGVGKPTIYRRWKTKAALVAEAFACHISRRLPEVDTGSFETDLRVMLTNVADRIEYALEGKILRGLISEANLDMVSAQAFRNLVESRRTQVRELVQRARARGELCPAVNDEDLVDEISGAILYRYLVRREKLDQAFIHNHIDFVLRASRK